MFPVQIPAKCVGKECVQSNVEYRTHFHIENSEFTERMLLDSLRAYVLKIHFVVAARERRNPPTQGE